MLRTRITFHFLLITSLLLSCQPPSTPPPQTSFLLYRFNPPAFVEYSADFEPVNEIPFSMPLSCGLNHTFPALIGNLLLIELSCPNGQTVLFLDTDSGLTTQPVTDSDSHFLAWASDGGAVYLKVDSFGSPRVIRAYPDGKYDPVAVNGFTYDLAGKPDSSDFIFTFSLGLGRGSELWFAQNDGHTAKQLYNDPYHYMSFARFSADGKQIAFIKIPDTQTPFTVGELWVMDTDGFHARKLADADAGHGYAANWSPDGKRLASGSSDQTVRVWEEGQPEASRILEAHSDWVRSVAWSPDGKRLASGSNDETVLVWEEGRPNAARVLDEAVKALQENAGLRIEVEGHTCNIGTAEYNLALGERRAKATRDHLVSLGIEGSRITVISYGEERPVCTERAESCWGKNRRAHFLVKQ